MKKLTEKQLIKLSFEERVKHAPYSIWIPEPNINVFFGSGTSDGYEIVDGITYFVSSTYNCNGHSETVNKFRF